jgi:hypothetical protein
MHHRFQGGTDITAAMLAQEEEKSAAAAAGAGSKRKPARSGRRAEPKQKPSTAAPAAVVPVQVPALASSFMRLTAALSSASLVLDNPSALLAPSPSKLTVASASPSVSTLVDAAANVAATAAGTTAHASGGIDATSAAAPAVTSGEADSDSLTRLLSRQTRLAKLKQSYTALAAEESAERAAEAAQRQVHRVRPRMQMHLLRGESATFSNQMTPLINPVERSIHCGRHNHAHTGSAVVDAVGLTSSSYDASHLGHARLRESAAQAASLLDNGGFDADAFEAPAASTAVANGNGSNSMRHQGHVRMPLSESSFRSQRFIYAKLNYLPLDGVQGYSEPVQRSSARRR